jgi:PAS domain S-box-containing protein
MVVLYDAQGRALMANSAFMDMISQVTQGRFQLGQSFADLLPDSIARENRRQMHRRAMAGESFRAEFSHSFESGAVRFYEASFQPVMEKESVTGFWEISRDITERKQLEHELSRSAQTYRTIFNAVNDMVIVHDAKTGRTLDVNQTTLDNLGWSKEEFLVLSPNQWSSQEPQYSLENAFALIRKAAQGQPQRFDWRVQGKNGQRNWVEVTLAKAQITGQDVVLAVTRDIDENKRYENQLAESEEKYRALFEQSGEGILLIRDKIIDVNQAAANILKMKKEDLIGKTLADAAPATQEDGRNSIQAQEQIWQQARAGRPQNFSWRMYDGQGSLVELDVSLKNISLGGQATLLATCRDITRRQEAERALRESEERLRILFDQAADAIYVYRPDGSLVQVNQEACRTLGYSQEEMMGLNLTDIQAARTSWDVIRQAVETLKPGRHINLETRYRKKDGSTFPVEVTLSLLETPNGVRVMGIVRDISDRKLVEEALRQSEDRFRVLNEESPLGISLIDQKGRYKYVNPAFVRMFGYTLDQVKTGKNWFKLAYPDEEYRKSVLKTWKEDLTVCPQGEARPRTFEVRCNDGTYKTIIFRPVTTAFHGQLVLYEDVSERKRAEEEKERLESQLRQSQKMEAVGTLAGGIAHDFNNILAAITGYSELALERARRGNTTPKELEQILKAADRAKELILQILAFSRTAETELKPLNLNRVVTDAIAIIERTIPKMIAVELNLARDLRPINGDSYQIEQVLLNLANNANDAMPDGGKLSIATSNASLDQEYANTHLEASPGDYVLLTVSDTGEGMDDETLEHIFEPFYTTKGVGKGTGLGLASVYGIVKSHGGHITCHSEQGKGATFKIYYPSLKPESLPVEAEKPDFDVMPGGSETILLVDDEETIRDLGQQILADLGYKVLVAQTGEEALDIFREQGPEIDLTVLDISMPGMGGHKCLQELLKIDPKAKVIIATGYSRSGRLKGTLDSGAAGYIAKPFRQRDLLHTIRSVLDA